MSILPGVILFIALTLSLPGCKPATKEKEKINISSASKPAEVNQSQMSTGLHKAKFSQKWED